MRAALGTQGAPVVAAPRGGAGVAVRRRRARGRRAGLRAAPHRDACLGGRRRGGARRCSAAHAVWKRVVRRYGRAAYLVHTSVAPIAIAAIAHHVARGAAPANAAGALTVAAGVALASGLVGGRSRTACCRRASRGSSDGEARSPRISRARAPELDARAFAELTGKSERLKAIFARLIRPYASARARPARAPRARTDPLAEEERLVCAADRARARGAGRARRGRRSEPASCGRRWSRARSRAARGSTCCAPRVAPGARDRRRGGRWCSSSSHVDRS